MAPYYFSFDTESCGLLGRPFAAGWVIVDEKGQELEEGYLACEPRLSAQQHQWVIDNVLPALPEPNCDGDLVVLRRFWEAWTTAKQQYSGIVMVSDCPWPVEAGFLLRCQKEVGFGMEDSPYPILDVASVMAAGGYDPIGSYDREPNEEPVHHPTNDARQSIRLMLSTMQEIAADRSLAIVHGRYGPLNIDSNPTWHFVEVPEGGSAVTITSGAPDITCTFTDARSAWLAEGRQLSEKVDEELKATQPTAADMKKRVKR